MRRSITLLAVAALALAIGVAAFGGSAAAAPTEHGSAWWSALSFALAVVIDRKA